MVPLVGLLAAAALVASFDQASKILSRRLPADGRLRPVGRRPGFSYVLNSRASLVALPLGWAVVLWIAVLAGAALALGQAAPSLGLSGAIGLGLALGGATSNLADRVL